MSMVHYIIFKRIISMYSACVAKRKNFTFRLDPDIIAEVAKAAEKEHRSLNNLVELTLIDLIRARSIELPKPTPPAE